MVRIIALILMILVLLGATIKTTPKEYYSIAGPFVNTGGDYIYDIVEEAKD